MARQARTSEPAKFADTRAAKLTSIDEALDLGNGKTLAAYTAKIAGVRAKNEAYNTALAQLDGELDRLEALEKDLTAFSVAMLAAVGVKFGKDSPEYEMAGGTRSSERKKTVRKPKTP